MLDARIPLGVQPMQIEPRSNALMRAAQLQGAQDNNALRQMQMQQMRAAAEQALKDRQMAAERQQQMEGYLASLSGRMGPPQQFNPMEAAGMFGIDGAKKLQDLVTPKQDNYKVVGSSLVQVGPNGVIEAYRAPDKPQSMPSPVQEYEYAKSQGYKGTYEQWVTSKARAGATNVTTYGSPVPVLLPDGSIGYAQPSSKGNAPPKIMTGPDNKPMVKPGDAEKPLAEGQAKSLAYASRMKAADQILNRLSQKGVFSSVPGSMGDNFIGDFINAMSPADRQELNQAKRDFITAALRRESGAVIGASEFATADRQYFPQINDDANVIANKAALRKRAIEAIAADVPKSKRGEIDRIVGGGADDSDPLGLRGN